LDPKYYNPNTVEGGFDELKFVPNTRLGMAWTELNRKRLQRKIKNSPEYRRLRYALLSGLLGCEKLPIPRTAQEETYGKVYAENEDRLVRIGYRPQGPEASELDMMELGMYENMTEIEYLAQALKVDRADWSMAYENNSQSFFDGILSGIYEDKDFYLKEDFILEMLRDLSTEDPDLRPFFKTYGSYQQFGYPFGERLELGTALGACEVLRRKARGVALPAFEEKTAATARSASLGEILQTLQLKDIPFQRCSQCHEGPVSLFVGRKIPFSEPGKLAEVLQSPAKNGRPLYEEIARRISLTGSEQMPPHGERISQPQQEELKRYVNFVMHRG
jgi:hypothetical protein